MCTRSEGKACRQCAHDHLEGRPPPPPRAAAPWRNARWVTPAQPRSARRTCCCTTPCWWHVRRAGRSRASKAPGGGQGRSCAWASRASTDGSLQSSCAPCPSPPVSYQLPSLPAHPGADVAKAGETVQQATGLPLVVADAAFIAAFGGLCYAGGWHRGPASAQPQAALALHATLACDLAPTYRMLQPSTLRRQGLNCTPAMRTNTSRVHHPLPTQPVPPPWTPSTPRWWCLSLQLSWCARVLGAELACAPQMCAWLLCQGRSYAPQPARFLPNGTA